jgi:hypothetical protein
MCNELQFILYTTENRVKKYNWKLQRSRVSSFLRRKQEKMVKFNSDAERNLTIVVGVLAGVVVIMAIVWGATWPGDDYDSDFTPAVTCPLTQFFAVNNIPVLPGNHRDIKIFYPTSFQNVPAHVTIQIVPQALTVAPPTSLTPVMNGNALSEVIAYRNDYLNFASSTLIGDAVNVFIGASTSPQNLAQNIGKWVAIKCTENGMTGTFGTLQATVDQISWETPDVIAGLNPLFTKASGPVLAVGYTTFAWFGVLAGGEQQLEIIDTTETTLVRTVVGPSVAEAAVNILGFQDLSSGSRIVVVWPSQAVSYHFNINSNVWDVNVFWTAAGAETCLAGAFTHESSLYDMVLMIQDGASATYVNFTHVIATQDNSWTRNPNGDVTAPVFAISAGSLFVNKASGTGDFFVYTSLANVIYITRVPQTWKAIDALQYNMAISTDVTEVAVLAKADLFGINDSICITYRSSGGIVGVNTVGILSFDNTSGNQQITVMSNARRNFVTAKMDLTVSGVQGVDSLILYTPVDATDFSGISQSFPLFATVNINVLAIQ